MRAWTMGAWAVGLAGAAALGCGSSGGMGGYGAAPAPAQCTAATASAVTNGTIGIVGMSYAPACAKVPAGTAVTFANDDSVAHTVTADDASFDSGAVAPGAQFTRTFAAAGTVGIHCSIHAGMRMTLFVQ